MTTKKKLNIGIIGTGWPGQQHAIALQGSDLGSLYACADLESARRSEFAKTFSPAKSFGDYRELLADRAVDAVVVCLPNFLHFPASLAALEAGKHVFCEKPPTMTAAEMKVLRDEAAKRSLIYFFGRQFRFTSGMLAAKELVEAGRLGSIYHAKADVGAVARDSGRNRWLVHGEEALRWRSVDRHRGACARFGLVFNGHPETGLRHGGRLPEFSAICHRQCF